MHKVGRCPFASLTTDDLMYFHGSSGDGTVYVDDIKVEDLNVGVEECSLIESGIVKIYPNPFTDKTTIEFSNPNQSNYKLSVFSITGNKVLEIENITKNKVEIKKGNLLNGIYIVELKGEKVFKNKMVIIK